MDAPRAQGVVAVRLGEDDERGEDGRVQLEGRAQREGVQVLEVGLHDGRALGQLERARREAQCVGALGLRRARAAAVDLAASALHGRAARRRRRGRVGLALLLRRLDARRALPELVEPGLEPRPALDEDLARAPEALAVRADDLEVGEGRERQGEEAERLRLEREGEGRRLVDAERLEVDDGEVGEVGLAVVVVEGDVAFCGTPSRVSAARGVREREREREVNAPRSPRTTTVFLHATARFQLPRARTLPGSMRIHSSLSPRAMRSLTPVAPPGPRSSAQIEKLLTAAERKVPKTRRCRPTMAPVGKRRPGGNDEPVMDDEREVPERGAPAGEAEKGDSRRSRSRRTCEKLKFE